MPTPGDIGIRIPGPPKPKPPAPPTLDRAATQRAADVGTLAAEILSRVFTPEIEAATQSATRLAWVDEAARGLHVFRYHRRARP